MKSLLCRGLGHAIREIEEASHLIPVHHLNESVFRFLLMRSIIDSGAQIKVVPECRKIDLVLHADSRKAFVELKYLVHTQGLNPHDLTPTYRKGYASRQNQKQFAQSVQVLREQSSDHGVQKYVVVFFADPDPCRFQTYQSWYGSDASHLSTGLSLVHRFKEFRCATSEHRCNAVLYELRSTSA